MREHTYMHYAVARVARRKLIDRGVSVPPIAYDPSRERYVFDAASDWQR